jgi:hypothetical protein
MRIDTSTIRVKPTKVYYLKMTNRPKKNIVTNNGLAVNELEKPIDPTESAYHAPRRFETKDKCGQCLHLCYDPGPGAHGLY